MQVLTVAAAAANVTPTTNVAAVKTATIARVLVLVIFVINQ